MKAVTVWKDDDGRKYVSETASAVVDIPALLPATGNKATPGITMSYYEGIWTVVPAVDSLRLLKKEVTLEISPRAADKTEHFALLFEGFIKAPEDGIYKFYVTSDDGSVLWIDGKKVVDNDGTHGTREMAGEIPLQAGLHTFRLGYFQTVTSLALKAEWEGPSFGRKRIEEEALYH